MERDELTGFATQQHFSGCLDRLIQRRAFRESPLTLVLLQLANFYEISAWVGGEEARLLLARLAALLKQTAPGEAWLCRCRNHEFALLLFDCDSHRLSELGDAIHRTLQCQAGDLVPPQLSLACGIGSVPIDTATPDCTVAFARARHDMWQRQAGSLAGQPGFTTSQEPELVERVREALARRSFRLSFQGSISFRSQALQRYETRITLLENERSLPAGSFLQTAVKNALGEPLDRLACELAITALAQDCHRQFTVNISPNSLVSAEFPDWLADNLPAGLARRLVLQVSELDILITQHHLSRFCGRIRDLQVGLAINHFGASEDPFRYLALFPANLARLHRSRLQQLTESPDRQRQLASMTRSLHENGLQILAPGIEKFSDLPLLWSAGVDLVQGYCLHRPSIRPDCEFVEELELNLD